MGHVATDLAAVSHPGRAPAAGYVPDRGGTETAITGATGFLGTRVARELLDRGQRLVLLAHAGSGDALTRLERYLTVTGAPPSMVSGLRERARAVEVDIGEPLLGLTPDAFHALAGALRTVWHCAADTTLSGAAEQVRRVNVEGTRHVLDLAAAAPGRVAVFHVSTAFVAGSRHDEVAYEDDLDGSQGFENPYERSKFDGEVLVRQWSARTGRPVVVFRPSLLLTDLPSHPDLPPHTLDAVARAVLTIASMAARLDLDDGGNTRSGGTVRSGGTGGTAEASRPTVRVVADPRARLNVMAVEDAAQDMVRIADRAPSDGVTTYHVVGESDLTLSQVLAFLEEFFPARFSAVPHPPADQTELERLTGQLPGFASYLLHRRAFDDTRARTVLGERPPRRPIDRDYLLSALGIGELIDRTDLDETPAALAAGGRETLDRALTARERRHDQQHRSRARPTARPHAMGVS
jgi:nucleoside-diphosphate-sugar epimerase